MSIIEKRITELASLLKNKEVSSVEMTNAFLNQIDQTNKTLQSFLSVTKDIALEDAKMADQKLQSGDPTHPMCGIPIGIKDIICTQGITTTAASKILENFTPSYDATVVDHLRNVSAVRIGKTNCDEFAMGSSNENSAFADCKNPWDTAHVPGGSSGGSAAAVSSRQAPATLGTDTGGSIRQPASLCGVVGIKPTYGRVSRFGSMAFASSLDQIGPFTNTVEDAAIVLDAISQDCKKDSTYGKKPFAYNQKNIHNDIKGKTIGIPWSFVEEYANEEVLENFKKQITFFESIGVTTKTIELPHQKFASACYYIIAPAEASSNLARYDGIRYTTQKGQAGGLDKIYTQSRSEGFGAEVQRRILLGTFVLSAGYYDAYYNKAREIRKLIRQDYADALESVDAIATPTTPTPAFKLGAKTDNPLEMYHADVFTVAVPLAGNPGLSIPTGFNQNGLPFGMQLVGRHFDEETLFQLGHKVEKEFEYFKKVPSL